MLHDNFFHSFPHSVNQAAKRDMPGQFPWLPGFHHREYRVASAAALLQSRRGCHAVVDDAICDGAVLLHGIVSPSGERFGAKHVLFGGMLLFGVASLGAGLAVNLTVMNFCRLLQGTGCAVLYTVSASILVSVMPSAGRGRALGMLFAANGLGLALGPRRPEVFLSAG